MKKFNLFLLFLIFVFSCKKDISNIYWVNSNLNLGISKNILKFSIRNKDNEEIFKELIKANLNFEKLKIEDNSIISDNFHIIKEENTLYISNFAKIKTNDNKIIITIKNVKKLYGLGERYGNVNLLDLDIKYKIYNEHHYSDRAVMPIPVIFTDTGKGFYFASPYKAFIEFKKEEDNATLIYSNEENNSIRGVDIYIISSDNLINVSSDYAKLTGLPPLPPKWLFGYIQSKYGYFSETETLNIAKKFVELDLPATGIVLDLYWFRYMGDIDWYERGFPDPVNFINELNNLGFKLINISEPFFDEKSKNFNLFKRLNYFGLRENENKFQYLANWWGKGGIFDFTNSIANNHLWNVSYKPLIKQGISGLWTDLGEPEKVPATTRFKLGKEKDIHNLYNYYWSKMLFDNWSKDFPEKRVVILSRSGWSCSPSLGVSVWSGDASAKWKEGLEIQPKIMISASLCNFSYWASDVGGFVGEGTPELYVRWSEFGLFSPIYRPHGAQVDREPWAFGDDALASVKRLLKLRARLHPYIYSTAYNTSFNGKPFIKPIDIPVNTLSKDKEIEIENLQYYFGDNIIYRVANKEGINNYDIYLPDKGNYLEYQSKKSYSGANLYTVEYKPGYPPFFLKPNGILVTNPDSNYKGISQYDIIVNNTSEGSSYFEIYDDDGITTDYKNGVYNLLGIKNSFNNNKIELTLIPLKTEYNKYKLPELNFIIYTKDVKAVKSENVIFNKDKGEIIFKINYPQNETKYILEVL
ncbi:MAG TPA: glycoside hydrolase family 31 protein [Spirochaetota bacterium]|nr:glycoside hydrolase family 31 protein [Spirochaetota bacterium]